MRARFVLSVLLGLAASAATAQTIPALPPGSVALEAQLMTKVGPETRARIRSEAATQRQSFADSLSARAVQGVGGDMNLAQGDIEALSFLVMMQATRSAQEDLRAIMAGVKQINDAKAALRQNTVRTNSAVAGLRAPGQTNTTQIRPIPNTVRPVIQPVPMPKPELDARIAAAGNNLDSLNELGEMESLRLQMAMDRMSKMMSTLSNLLKKISETSSGITQNLK
jgi:hypothetical protein